MSMRESADDQSAMNIHEHASHSCNESFSETTEPRGRMTSITALVGDTYYLNCVNLRKLLGPLV
jgi:hypothetical protein